MSALIKEILASPSSYAAGNPFEMSHPLYEMHFRCKGYAAACAEVEGAANPKAWADVYDECYREAYNNPKLGR